MADTIDSMSFTNDINGYPTDLRIFMNSGGKTVNTLVRSGNIQFHQNYPNAIQSTVDYKLNEIVSVKDFGAKGDGIFDDTNAIQLAFNSSSSVFFPIGIYKISIPNISINLPPNAEFFGIGNKTIIHISNNNCGFKSEVNQLDSVIIRNIQFIISNNSTAFKLNRSGINVNNVCDLHIFDCVFHSIDSTTCTGLSLTGLNQSIISRNTFYSIPNYQNSNFTCILFETGKETVNGVDYYSTNINSNVCDNYFYNSKNGILIVEPNDDSFFRNAGYRVINNMFLAIFSNGILAFNADWLQIEQNMMDYVGQPIYIEKTINVKIKNNYLAANQDNSIITILSNSMTSIYSNMEYTEIIGNRLFSYRKAQGFTGGDGVVLTATTKTMNFFNISDNTIDNTITAININAFGLIPITSGNIESNKIQAVENGVYLGNQTSGIVVQSNSISCNIPNAITGIGVNNNIIETNILLNYPTKRIGKLITTGNGSQKQWIIPHNLCTTPVWATATVGDPTIAANGLYV